MIYITGFQEVKERRPEVCADAISFLERHRSGGACGWGLLGHALEHRKARLAVVASAFSDVSYLQCVAA